MIIENYIETYMSTILSDLGGIAVDILDKPAFNTDLDSTEAINHLFGFDTLDEALSNIRNKFSLAVYSRTAPRKSEALRAKYRPILVANDGTSIEQRLFTQSTFTISIKLLTNDVDHSTRIMQYYLCELANKNSMSSTIKIGNESNDIILNLTHSDLEIDDFAQGSQEHGGLHMVSWTVDVDAPLISPVSTIYNEINKVIVNVYSYNKVQEILYSTFNKTV